MWQNRLEIFAGCYHSARQVLTLETLRERESERERERKRKRAVRSSKRLVGTRSRGDVREIFILVGKKENHFLKSFSGFACSWL